MKQFWQMMLSFIIQELVTCYDYGPSPVNFIMVLLSCAGQDCFRGWDMGAVLLHAVSFVVIGRFLRRQWTGASPYVYKRRLQPISKAILFWDRRNG